MAMPHGHIVSVEVLAKNMVLAWTAASFASDILFVSNFS